MPLTPQQIAEARSQYRINTDSSVLNVGQNTTTANDPTKLTGASLSAILTGQKVTTKTPVLGSGDTVVSRGRRALSDAFSSLTDKFSARSKDVIDTTLKTANELDAVTAPTKQDVHDLLTGQNVTNNPVIQKLAAPLKNALNTVGQVAGGAGDILAEGIKAGYKTLTPEQRQLKLSEGVHSLLATPEGQAGLEKIGEGLDAYNAWKSTNPDSAKAVENVLNIAALFGGRTAEEAVTPVIKKGAETTIDYAKQGLENAAKIANQGFDKLDDITRQKVIKTVEDKAFKSVTPVPSDLTPTEYDDFVKQGKIIPKSGSTPAQYVLSDQEKEIAKKYASIIQDKDPVKNTINISNEIASKDSTVGKFLAKNNTIFNDGELKNFLTDKMKDISDITIDDARLDAKKAQMIDNFIKGLPKNNMESLWTSRKAFDQYIEKAFSGSPTLTKELKKGLRNGVQDFIADRTPEGVYKGYMKDMSQLFDLRDITATKATGEKGKNWLQVWIKQNPAKAKALGWTLGSIPVAGVGYQFVK